MLGPEIDYAEYPWVTVLQVVLPSRCSLPINESAEITSEIKAKLTEYISKAVQEMQQSKQREENILQCYKKTGVLDAWSLKGHELYQDAVEKCRELFLLTS